MTGMHEHELIAGIVGGLLVILMIGLLLRRFNQPHVIGYLVAGIVMGPNVLGLISDQVMLARIGDFGVMLLLFFIGLEVSLPRLLSSWKLFVSATLLQICISILMMNVVGYFVHWPVEMSILLGFIISLSSTAVVIKILEDWKEANTETGQKVIGILIFQDIMLIPMIIVLNLFGSGHVNVGTLLLQVIGSVLIIGLLGWVMVRGTFSLPYAEKIREDHELQIFVSLVICFGLAFLTLIFGLSSALGAFVAGVLISFSQETSWISNRLESFKIVFVALFFVSIGMLVNIHFIIENFPQVLATVLIVFAINSAVMAVLFKLFKHEWRSSLYAGALLSQVGEFGFVLVLIGKDLDFVTDYTYQLTLAMITLTLILSPLWINFVKRGQNIRLLETAYRLKNKAAAKGP